MVMKKIRKVISKWQIILPMVCVFIFFSCFNDDQTAIVKKEYSGEELFRGLFFLEGEVAQRLESLKPNLDEMATAVKANAEIQKSYNDFTNEIMKQIKILDPDFLKNFKKQIHSDNYYSIELALGNGSRMIQAAGFASEKYSGLFRLASDVQEKQVDFTSAELAHLDLNNPEDREKFQSILKENYAIDVDDEKYIAACIPAVGFCIYYAIAGVVSIAAFSHTALGTVQAVAVFAYYVYSKVEFWGVNNSSNDIARTEGIIAEIAKIF